MKNIRGTLFAFVLLTSLLFAPGPLSSDGLGCIAHAAEDPCEPEEPKVPAAGRYGGDFTINYKAEGKTGVLFVRHQDGFQGTLILYVEDDQSVDGPLKGSFKSSGVFEGGPPGYSTTGSGDARAYLKGNASPGKSFQTSGDSAWHIYRTDSLGYSSEWTGEFDVEFIVVEATCTRMAGVISKERMSKTEAGFNPLLLPTLTWIDLVWKAQMDGAAPGWEQKVDDMAASSLRLVPHINLIRNLLQQARQLELSDLSDGAKKCLHTKLMNAATIIAAKRLTSALAGESSQEILRLARDLVLMGFDQQCPLLKQAFERARKLALDQLKEAIKNGDILAILQALKQAVNLGLQQDSQEARDAMAAIGNTLDKAIDRAIKSGDRLLVAQLAREASLLGFRDIAEKGIKYFAP